MPLQRGHLVEVRVFEDGLDLLKREVQLTKEEVLLDTT